MRTPSSHDSPLKGSAGSGPAVRHRLDFHLDSDLYLWLEGIATEHRLLHDYERRPRLAELVRVLLLSALHTDLPVRQRVAYAFYSHVVLGLSEQLSLIVAETREAIAEVVAAAAGAPAPPLAPYRPRRGERRQHGTLTLVLDDHLHDALRARLKEQPPAWVRPAGSRVREPRPDVVLIRDLLVEAKTRYRDPVTQHAATVEEYSKGVRRLRTAVRQAVQAERDALIQALSTRSNPRPKSSP